MALSERSEFDIFRDKRSGMKAPDSLSGLKPFQELLCLPSSRSKKVREYHNKVTAENKSSDD